MTKPTAKELALAAASFVGDAVACAAVALAPMPLPVRLAWGFWFGWTLYDDMKRIENGEGR